MLGSGDCAANRQWRGHYSARWKVADLGIQPCWHRRYGSKMRQLLSWTGKYTQDQLYGHKEGVRCIKLLPNHNLLASGGATSDLICTGQGRS